LLLLNLALDPSGNFLPLEAPRPPNLETRNLASRGELVGGLLIDLEKFGDLLDCQNLVRHKLIARVDSGGEIIEKIRENPRNMDGGPYVSWG
jgi:hypothetical protein